MRVLVVDDDDAKFSSIASFAQSCLDGFSVVIERARDLREATKFLYERKYDLIVLDLLMPRTAGSAPIDISEDIINVVSDSEVNQVTRVIAFSGFGDIVDDRLRAFNEVGISVVEYEESDSTWKVLLRRELQSIRQISIFDFVIVCALEKERQAYRETNATIGELRRIQGLDCQEVTIGSRRGVLVRPPRAGLIDAGFTVTRSLELFKPRVVAMSGICAGVPGEAQLGSCIVADPCWDYQVGKWVDGSFLMEPYSVGISESVRTIASQMIAKDASGARYKIGLGFDDLEGRSVSIAPLASGSAVIADMEEIKRISDQHRKLSGVEMEMYGLYRSAALFPSKPLYVGVKTVVDLGDSNKDDLLHNYGAVLSARFLCDLVNMILDNLDAP